MTFEFTLLYELLIFLLDPLKPHFYYISTGLRGLFSHGDIFMMFIILIPTPDFPHFYYMLGGNLGSLLYGDVTVMCSK